MPVPMPERYIAEMIMDRIAASKVYRGKAYTDEDPLNYYLLGKGSGLLHPDTAEILEKMLRMLAEKGEEEAFRCIKRELVKRQATK